MTRLQTGLPLIKMINLLTFTVIKISNPEIYFTLQILQRNYLEIIITNQITLSLKLTLRKLFYNGTQLQQYIKPDIAVNFQVIGALFKFVIYSLFYSCQINLLNIILSDGLYRKIYRSISFDMSCKLYFKISCNIKY